MKSLGQSEDRTAVSTFSPPAPEGTRSRHAARRLEIFGMDKSGELPGFSPGLRTEAEKLKAWRQKAVRAIVGNLWQLTQRVGAQHQESQRAKRHKSAVCFCEVRRPLPNSSQPRRVGT